MIELAHPDPTHGSGEELAGAAAHCRCCEACARERSLSLRSLELPLRILPGCADLPVTVVKHHLSFELLLRTGQKTLASCYATSGYMRQKLKFGDALVRGGNAGDPMRIVILRVAINPCPLVPIVAEGRTTSLCVHARPTNTLAPRTLLPPITNHDSLITGFLIDTPAIRNASNSCPCIVDVHSNRHSSRPCKLHRNAAFAPELCSLIEAKRLSQRGPRLTTHSSLKLE